LGPRGEAHSLAGEGGWRAPIPTKGQTHWYSMHTIIPLRCILGFKTLKLLDPRQTLFIILIFYAIRMLRKIPGKKYE
jgi:hypothetical protein